MANDEHIYWEYLEEYTASWVFTRFKEGEQLLYGLIKPQMYQKALSEFIKNGKLVNFPIKYVYQWMGTIMRNTAILRSCTSICGHDYFIPLDEFIDVFFNGDREEFNAYKLTLTDKGRFDVRFGYMEKDEYDEVVDDDDAYNQFLDDHNFCDYIRLRDGSIICSDYGVRPLEELIAEYDSNMEPEQVLVLINKILDVNHQNGDLCSLFIEGGSFSQTSITNGSYNINENIDMSTKKDIFDYKPYILSLSHYMRDKGYTAKKLPRVILDNKDQGDAVFVYTGYFDPDKKGIRLFIHNRHPKDVLRTLAHELIHWKQDVDGVIAKSGYTGDKITEDKNLVKLEEEAYLKGNMAFRSWTEEEQKKGKLK